MADEDAARGPLKSRIAKLIAEHPQLVSSVIIGFAGLIATSIWQYRQQQTQKAQAEAAQKVAQTQAENSWKIERADVLGKNLAMLAQTGPGTANERYGVLLSLVRAEIIDPELAVSYALELGKDNPDYMLSVLENTQSKDYRRLLHAYTLSCDARYGVSPPIEACTDKLAQRSEMLGVLMAEDVTSALVGDQPGPLVLLKDERHVQREVEQLTGVFALGLLGMYDRRQWDDLNKFEQTSDGAHLVGALVLAAARTGELGTDDDTKTLEQFHATQTKWLTDYLSSKTCDGECKGHLLDVMVTRFSESQGDFDAAMRKLIESPPAQSSVAIARLHQRLLWCQVDDTDLAPLRDHVLVPALVDELGKKSDAVARDAILSLLAIVPEPAASDSQATATWVKMLAAVDREASLGKTFRERHALALKQRASPPAALRRVSFCNPPPTASSPSVTASSTSVDGPAVGGQGSGRGSGSGQNSIDVVDPFASPHGVRPAPAQPAPAASRPPTHQDELLGGRN
jgi:hypothetical protein